MALDTTHAPKSGSSYQNAANVGTNMNNASRVVRTPMVLKTNRQLNILVI